MLYWLRQYCCRVVNEVHYFSHHETPTLTLAHDVISYSIACSSPTALVQMQGAWAMFLQRKRAHLATFARDLRPPSATGGPSGVLLPKGGDSMSRSAKGGAS